MSSHDFKKVIRSTSNKKSEEDKQTLKTVESFKKSLVSQYSTTPSSAFIRRKLALLLLRQKNPQTDELSDVFFHETIDRKIRSLKQNDTQRNSSHTDEFYTEILIRTNFNEAKAFEMLRDNRPDLTVPIVTAVAPRVSTTASMGDSLNALKDCRRRLQEPANGDESSRKTLRPNDAWQKVNHIISTIRQLRHDSNEVSFSRIYRILYSELSNHISRQLPVKIEALVSVLLQLPTDVVDLLDISTLKNILLSSDNSQLSDSFREYARNLLAVECPICASTFPRSQMESMYFCDHTCCTGCAKRYYEGIIGEIRDSSALNRLTCVGEVHEIPPDIEMDFFIYLEVKIKRLFADKPNIIQLYHENIFNATRDKQIIKKCGNPKCVSYFYVDDNQRVASTRCPHCRFAQCQLCCRKWCAEHATIPCDEYDNWLIDNDPDDPHVQVLNSLGSSAILCPNSNCKDIFKLEPGFCEHFTCRTCQTHFCRICSTLYYGGKTDKKCPQANCIIHSLHAHCPPNCFRETRDGQPNVLAKLLTDQRIDFTTELRKIPVQTAKKCPKENCGKETYAGAEHRLCEACYRTLLCLLIWDHQILPWEVYEDNNLQQMLIKASVSIPTNATRKNLIDLCHKHLNQTLGKAKRLTKRDSGLQ